MAQDSNNASNAAGKMDRQIDHDPLVAILADLHDPIARLDADPAEHERRAANVVSHVAPGQRAKSAVRRRQPNRRPMRLPPHPRAKHGHQSFPRIVHPASIRESQSKRK